MHTDYLIFTLLLMVLILSGIITTRYISKISSYLKLGHYTAGFIIIAVATSIPELIVGITSAIEGIPELSLGNVLGSNVVNLSLIIGTAVLIAGEVNFKENKIKKELIYPFFIALLPILLAVDGMLSFWDGLILIIIFLSYFLIVFRHSISEEEEEKVNRTQFLRSILFFTLGLVALLVSARYLVDYASLIAIEMGIPIFFIGIILVSFGTSLPELVFETISMLQGYKILAIGDLMGSTVANSTLILGAVSIISPVLVPDFTEFEILTVFLIILIGIFVIFLRSETGITRKRALILILIYFFFLILTGFTI